VSVAVAARRQNSELQTRNREPLTKPELRTTPIRGHAHTPTRLRLRAPSYLAVIVFRPAAQRLARKRRAHLRKRVRIIRLKERQ
jgi:hypothetical protein